LEGSGKGAPLFVGAVGGRGGSRKDIRTTQGPDIILHGGTAGEFSRGLVYRALGRLWRRAPSSIGALLTIMGGPFTGNSES